MEEDNSNTERQEVFNMSLAILQRINNLINAAATSHKSKNYSDWLEFLFIIKQQISYKFSKAQKENKIFVAFLLDLKEEFNQTMFYDEKSKDVCLKKGEQYTAEDLGIFKCVIESYEDFLLSCMDSYGWLTIKKEESGLF